MNAIDFRRDVNGLRGLSVILVVAFHLHLRGSGGGYVGVDVFFVISGYLMTKIIWDGMTSASFSYLGFVCSRAARIWPALAVLIAALFLVGAFVLPPFDLEIISDQAAYAILFWSNQFFHDRSGYNTQSADANWLLHTWSLSVEWQFYVVYPLILMGSAGLQRYLWPTASPVQRRQLAVSTVALLFVASLGYYGFQSDVKPDGAFFLLPSRAWEMLAGGLAYFFQPRGDRSRALTAAFVSYAGLALIVFSVLLIGYLHIRPVGVGYYLMLPVAGVVMVLLANHQGNVVLNSAAMQKVGLWSYSIYLWHWPLIVGFKMGDVFVHCPRLGVLGVVVASVLCGWLSYRFVESMGGRRARSTWRVAQVPALAMGLAVAMTTVVAATDGLESRNGGRRDLYRGYWASVKPVYFPDDCSNFKRTAAESQICPVHKGGTRRILVIGDSHAEHLYPWFVEHSAVSVDFYTQAECPPVPRFERVQSGFHCMDYAGAAWQMAASPTYDTLIVAARWQLVGLNGPPYCHLESPGKRCAFPALTDKQELVRSELRSAIERLLALGKTVVVLETTPEARVRVPERLTREAFWYGQTRLAIDKQIVTDMAGWITPLFDELQRKPGFHLVSLNDKLCSGSVCRVYDPELQRPIFNDESHFDPFWIAKNGNIFLPFVRADGPKR